MFILKAVNVVYDSERHEYFLECVYRLRFTNITTKRKHTHTVIEDVDMIGSFSYDRVKTYANQEDALDDANELINPTSRYKTVKLFSNDLRFP